MQKIFTIGMLLITVILCSQFIFGQKISIDDLIEKHRASVASPTRLNSIKNQLVFGNAQFRLIGSSLTIYGKALLLSARNKNLLGMSFNSNDYPLDRFAYDGKDVRISKPNPTSWSILGQFLYDHRELVRDGLLGGTLSSSWPLFNYDSKKLKLSGGSIKTIGGKEALVFSYEPKSGSDVSIKLYFDRDTYQHIRTEYTFLREASQGGSVDSSAGRSSTIYQLVEEFTDFRKMGDLVLPGTYKITFSTSGNASIATTQNANREMEWLITITGFSLNSELPADSFDINAH